MSIFRSVVVSIALLLQFLSLAAGEPDALIRFADGSVVEIENRIAHQNANSDVSPLVLPSTSHHHLSNVKAPARNSLGDHKIVTREPLQHCGSQLIKAVSLVCDGKFRKRARLPDNALTYDVDQGENSGEQKDESDGLPELFELIKYASGHSRGLEQVQQLGEKPRKRGLVEECCKKPCNINTLSSYCKK